MARTRAKDHDDKRVAIMETAARIFADGGYDRTSMAQLASECGVSKALIYHYYASKEALLFDIIDTHLSALIDAVDAADLPDAAPEQRLEALVAGLLEAYRDADAKHKVQLGALTLLPKQQQDHLKGLERQLVTRFSGAVHSLNPDAFAGKSLLKPVTMSLFGMLNWFYMWFREGGQISRRDYAKLATALLIDGVRSLKPPS